MKKSKIKALTEVSLFVAILGITSQIIIPIGMVPVTLQVFSVSLAGYYLGLKKGTVAIIVYLLLGCVGVPVFAGLKGGFYMLFSYTGGFIIGFLPLTVMCGISKSKVGGILFGIVGLCACHIIGGVQYSAVGQIPLFNSFAIVSLPYIIKDVCLVIVSFFVAKRIKKALR